MTPENAERDEQDELSMALCAIRYCMGRQSYIVASGIQWARKYGAKSQWIRKVVIEDIERRLRMGGSLGMEMDKTEWLAVLNELKAMETVNVA